MAENIQPTDAVAALVSGADSGEVQAGGSDAVRQGSPIPVHLAAGEPEPMQVEQGGDVTGDTTQEEEVPTLDELIEQHRIADEIERKAMEELCSQVMQVGIADPSRYMHIVLSSLDIGKDRFVYEGQEVRWVLIRRNRMEDVKKIIINFLSDPLPKRIIVDCLARFWIDLSVPMRDVMTTMKGLASRMDTIFNVSIVFSSEVFRPTLENRWPYIAAWNLYVRNINIQMNMSPLCVHKCLLRSLKNQSKMAVKGDVWFEFKTGAGLGSTLNADGIQKVTKWYGKHLKEGMDRKVDHSTPLTSNENEPECLAYTPGYKTKVMVTHLKIAGLNRPERPDPRGERGSWKRRNYNNSKVHRVPYNREAGGSQQSLHSVERRASTSSSSSSSTGSTARSVFSYGKGGKRGGVDLADHVRVERDNQDLRNIVETLKDQKEQEIQKRRDREENLGNTIQRLFNEMEWINKDRTELSSKLIKAEMGLHQMKEDRDALSDENSKLRSEKQHRE